MTGKEARQLTPEQLDGELTSLRGKLYTLRTQAVTEKVEDNSQFGKIKRDIARILTIQREQLNQAEPGRKRRARPEAPAKAPAKKAPARTPAGAKAATKSKPRGRAKAKAASR
jgi:large subunit ribosomal protein L29